MGLLPPRAANSLLARAITVLPSTRPMISGRMYWTAAAWCRPRAPEMSRRKQAMQKPMLAGFPNSTSPAEMMPIPRPARIMVVRSFFKFIGFPSLSFNIPRKKVDLQSYLLIYAIN